MYSKVSMEKLSGDSEYCYVTMAGTQKHFDEIEKTTLI